ncbi:GNAT family N-acetyltransferase [bacterium]|nr:GNAT family N-acetyltransferase [bacterium]
MLYFETERLFIRSLSENDLGDFLDYRSDPEVVKWQGFGVWDEAEARAFLLEQAERRIADDDQWTQLGVELKADRKLIGDLAVQLHSDHSAHIGATLNARYQRQGFAREALSGLINYLHETLSTNAVIGLTDARNAASIKLLESLRFNFEKEDRDVPYKGEFCTEYTYRLLIT